MQKTEDKEKEITLIQYGLIILIMLVTVSENK